MSRKWERMVLKNSNQLNKQRKKRGQPALNATPGPAVDRFRGRSIFLPLFLVMVSLFFMTVSQRTGETGTLYWFTVILYLLLALYFFMRRPYLAVGKNELMTRRLGRDRIVKADEVSEVIQMKGYCIIALKGKRTRWIFSRFMNRYDTDAMAKRLKQFADQHGITYTVQ